MPTAEDILAWIHQETPLLRAHNRLDALPGGLSLAMMPALVSWRRSRPDAETDPHYLVHNVNVGGNPVAGTTDLATVRIPRDGIASIEFVMALSRVLGVDTPGGHGMIRFVFRPDRRPLVFAHDGKPLTNRPELEDLVFSWEAWRPPMAAFDGQKGLDPAAYALTMRCAHGPDRFLSDGLQHRPWLCYPLALPVSRAAPEILHFCLVLGDALARHTFTRILEDAAPADGSTRVALETDRGPEDPTSELLGNEIGYHLLLRSCITMSLTSIDMGVERACRSEGVTRPQRLEVTPGPLPDWIGELPHADPAGIFQRLPQALSWVAEHHRVIPAAAYQILRDAGLLHRKRGRTVYRYYDLRRRTPYGKLSENLIL
ncbi:MAG: hypothetical protein R3E12_01645 [Candidatus Eisenbacteria bacterium]